MNFDTAFQNVIGVEGGYVNNKNDNGGETKFGISKRAYPNLDIAELTLDEAKQIYKRDYWDRIKGDQLPYALAEFVFDYAVNSGVITAIKALQRSVGALPDGVIGPKTIACVQQKGALQTVRIMFVDRAMLFAHHEDLEEFGHGWFARLFDVTERFLKA